TCCSPKTATSWPPSSCRPEVDKKLHVIVGRTGRTSSAKGCRPTTLRPDTVGRHPRADDVGMARHLPARTIFAGRHEIATWSRTAKIARSRWPNRPDIVGKGLPTYDSPP